MTVRATCLDVETGQAPRCASGGCKIPQGHPQRTLTKWCSLAIIVIVQVFASTYPVLHAEEWYQAFLSWRSKPDDPMTRTFWERRLIQYWFYVVAAVVVLVICAGVVSTSMRPQCHDRLEKTLEHYLLTKWAVCISFAAHTGFLWFIPHEVLRNVVGLLPDLLQVFSEYLLYSMFQDRLHFLEAAWGRSLGSVLIGYVKIAAVMLSAGLSAAGSLDPSYTMAMSSFTWSGIKAIYASATLCIAAIMWVALSRVRLPTCTASAFVGQYTHAERKWAKEYLGRLRFALAIPLCLDACSALVVGASFHCSAPWLFKFNFLIEGLQRLLSLITEVTSMLLLVGIFQLQKPEIQLQVPSMQRGVSSEQRSRRWRKVVSKLANRGMNVGMLLDFYEQLGRPGSCMPMYNPKVSTTNDVVRHAIIPMSRAGAYGRAYANLGDPAARKVPPTRMVTHNRDNTFLDLVSAIVADALNEGAYEHIANQLADGHTGKIRQLVASVGALQLRYWICAFCVNQHAGICGGFGPQPAEGAARRRFEKNRRDTATNEVFELCHCRTPKVFSGDQCEMNKFDDMMALLHGRNRSFTQLVAVDREFDIFTRAWCVAELVQASVSGLVQHVQLHERRQLDISSVDVAIYAKISRLKVENCQASRPQDKADILRKIPCFADFNTQLHALIFGEKGLLRCEFRGFGLLDAAVRTARRMEVLNGEI